MDAIYEHFDGIFDGAEYALIDTNRPFGSLKEEVKAYFGDITLNHAESMEILKEIGKYDFPRFEINPPGGWFIGIGASDFTVLVATIKEV